MQMHRPALFNGSCCSCWGVLNLIPPCIAAGTCCCRPAGYCVPRQAFVTVNLTALACNPGSNLTKWDGQDVW